MGLTLRLVILSFLLACVFASSGDRANDFQRCLEQCNIRKCAADSIGTTDFSIFMRLARWTCTDDCKYHCMHMVTDFSLESGVPIQQYYGKWPFWRRLGMQEPASVVFSLMNLILHTWGRGEIQRAIPKQHPMKPYYLTWSLISINAWTWSAVFHTRG
jgi:post-GPI attachment to proteins factor 3